MSRFQIPALSANGGPPAASSGQRPGSEQLIQVEGRERRSKSSLLIGASGRSMAGITTCPDGSERRAKFLHARQDVLVHPGSEASARMVRMHGVQTNLARALCGVEGKTHKAGDRLPNCDGQHVMARSGCADVI